MGEIFAALCVIGLVLAVWAMVSPDPLAQQLRQMLSIAQATEERMQERIAKALHDADELQERR